MRRKLTGVEIEELKLLIRDPKYGSSDRDRDRARAKLKKLGLITFDRKAWTWVILPAGHRALLSGEA